MTQVGEYIHTTRAAMQASHGKTYKAPRIQVYQIMIVASAAIVIASKVECMAREARSSGQVIVQRSLLAGPKHKRQSELAIEQALKKLRQR
jgi:hypothetical protein